MKNHYMSLYPIPFKKIKDGIKTIEMRLYDEKRQDIKIGDTITFVNTIDENERMVVNVLDLYVFDSFEELYKNLPLTECGYTKETIDTAHPSDMNKYYTKELQEQYKVVGIKISL